MYYENQIQTNLLLKVFTVVRDWVDRNTLLENKYLFIALQN